MVRSSHPNIYTPEMLMSRETQEELHPPISSSSKPTEHAWKSTFSQSFGSNSAAPEAALSLQQKWMET